MTSNSFKLNRFLATPLTSLFLKTLVTPNQVTLLSLACGIGSGILFAQGTFMTAVCGALAFNLSAVLDNCDGDIARAKNMRSEFGGWLDVVADVFVDLAFFTGLAMGLAKNGAEGPIRLFWALCITGSVVNFLIVIIEKIKGFGPAVFNQSNPKESKRDHVIFKIADALREGDSSWFTLIFVLLDKTAYLLWFGGIYVQVLWISSLAMNFKWLFAKSATHK